MYVLRGRVYVPQVLLSLQQFVGVNSVSEQSAAAAATVTPAGRELKPQAGLKKHISALTYGEL